MRREAADGARKLRAMSHPLRSQMVDLLAQAPSTATELARRLGVTSGTTSYHLRELEKAGLIIDLRDHGTGRDRVWFSPFAARNYGWSDLESMGATGGREYRHAWLDLRFRSAAEFQDRVARGEEPEEWRKGPVDVNAMMRMTSEELRVFTQEMQELMARWITRRDLVKGAESDTRVVDVQFRAFPVALAPQSASRDDGRDDVRGS